MMQKLSAIWAILTAGKNQHWFLLRKDTKDQSTSHWVDGWTYSLAEGFCDVFSRGKTGDLYSVIQYGMAHQKDDGVVIDFEQYRRGK
jgi:hypothetical protein